MESGRAVVGGTTQMPEDRNRLYQEGQELRLISSNMIHGVSARLKFEQTTSAFDGAGINAFFLLLRRQTKPFLTNKMLPNFYS